MVIQIFVLSPIGNFNRIGSQLYRQRPFQYNLPEEGDRDLPRSQLVIPRTAAPRLAQRIRDREDYRGQGYITPGIGKRCQRDLACGEYYRKCNCHK